MDCWLGFFSSSSLCFCFFDVDRISATSFLFVDMGAGGGDEEGGRG